MARALLRAGAMDLLSSTSPRWLLSVVLAVAACTGMPGGDDPSCTTGKCDDPGQTSKAACKVTGLTGGPVDLATLGDPVAELVLKPGDDCPTTFAELQAKLRRTDARGCESGGGAGLFTAVINHEAAVLGGPSPDRGRVAVARVCGGREPHDLMFDMEYAGTELQDGTVLFGFDRERGLYNFYALGGGQWIFAGNSLDAIDPAKQGQISCFGCHTTGGPLMKELERPWLHWEGAARTPGAAELVAAHGDDLGSRIMGPQLEQFVKQGIEALDPTERATRAKGGTVAELLRPLFCDSDLQVGAAGQGFSPADGALGQGADLSEIPAAFFVDPSLVDAGGVAVTPGVYLQAIKAAGQHVDSSAGPMTSASGAPAIDTVFDFAFPKRAFVDQTYVAKLFADPVGREFTSDVLAADFTRPILSSERCALLAFAPVLPAGARDAESIRKGFVTNLQAAAPAAGTVAAGFLADLQVTNAADHAAKARGFVAACGARPRAELMADVMKVVSLRRQQARARFTSFFEPALMPHDQLGPDASQRLDPTTCTLR